MERVVVFIIAIIAIFITTAIYRKLFSGYIATGEWFVAKWVVIYMIVLIVLCLITNSIGLTNLGSNENDTEQVVETQMPDDGLVSNLKKSAYEGYDVTLEEAFGNYFQSVVWEADVEKGRVIVIGEEAKETKVKTAEMVFVIDGESYYLDYVVKDKKKLNNNRSQKFVENILRSCE